MWRYIFSFLFIATCGFLLFSGNQKHVAPKPEALNPEHELQIKQTLLEQDVQITDDLCRSQCALDLQHLAAYLEHQNPGTVQQSLQKAKSEHEHMKQLVWSSNNQTLEQGTKAGEVQPDAADTVKTHMIKAKETAISGKMYQSPMIQAGNQQYFVLGVPSADGKKSLVGLVHQDILQKVADHQRKNLRIEVYPNKNRWKMESVDSNTLKDKNVAHPEDNEGTSHYQQNEVVVKFKQPPTNAQLAQIKAEIGAKSVQKIGYTYVFITNNKETKELMTYFQKWNIDYAEPHFLYLTNENMENDTTQLPSTFTPNDSLYSKYQWNLPMIDTVQGWQVNKGAQDIIVAVVDTGVDLNHPDLKDHLVQGVNIVNKDATPLDDVGHGTHVAGVISAGVNNGIGVAGMTWFNRVMPVKVLDQTGAGSTYSVAQGIIWAADHGAKVINMSLGNYADANFLHDAIKYAFDKDIVLIAASGNDNTDRPGYPAAYPEVFAVAATDSNKSKAPFSNYGDYIDVAAPGVNIASTYPNNQYAALSGTSMASPHVTALAALIRSTNPLLKNTEVMDIMRHTAIDLGDQGRDKYFGYGLIDVVNAVQTAEQSKYSLSYWPQWAARELLQIKQKYVYR